MKGRQLLVAPLQPWAEALSGRGHVVLLLDWVNVAPGHYASHHVHPAAQA